MMEEMSLCLQGDTEREKKGFSFRTMGFELQVI